jgi:hypothetical protein
MRRLRPPARPAAVRRAPAALAVLAWLAAGCGGDSPAEPVGPVNNVDPVAAACRTPQPLALAVGQVQTFRGCENAELTLAAGSTDQQFVVVPYFASELADTLRPSVTLALTASGGGSAAADGVAAAEPLRARGAARAADGADGAGDGPLVTDAPLHRRLRELTRRHLGPERIAAARATRLAGARAASEAPGARTPGGVSRTLLQANPRVGDLVRVNTNTASPCDTVTSAFRTGRVAAVTERLVILADTANPRDGFTDAEYQRFALAFDTLAYPVTVANFGEPSDVDRNQRSIAFFTRAVNEETPRGADYVVGGYFWERDLFPNNVRTRDNCAGSNAAEFFYMLVPDPRGTVNGNPRSKDYVAEVTVGTLAHEFQHLINAARRLYVTDALDFEEVWLNEGLSHVAEELVFFRAAGLAPRGRVSAATLRASNATFDAFTLYGNDNLRRVLTYLRDPENRSPFGRDDDLETRGATWQFLRYAADRLAADAAPAADAALWKRLVDNRTVGRRNLQSALGGSAALDDWFQDWTVANLVDAQSPALAGLAPRFTFPSWSFRSVLTSYNDTSNRPYPLATRTLASDVQQTVRLVGGGSAYLRYAVSAGRSATLRTRTTVAPTSGTVRVAVVRTR